VFYTDTEVISDNCIGALFTLTWIQEIASQYCGNYSHPCSHSIITRVGIKSS